MKKKYYQKLSFQEKKILKEKGTEPPFSGKYNDFFSGGLFLCRACQSPLYESSSKFDSGCGWPSFDDEIDGAIVRYNDFSAGRTRVEICCANCDGHLGHVFHGEKFTLKDTRHCVNSLSIQFKSYKNLQKAFFGSTCFWNLQKIFNAVEGIYMSTAGYMDRDKIVYNYKEESEINNRRKKVVEIFFDPKIVSYNKLVNTFLENHDFDNFNKNLDKLIIFYFSEEQKKIAKKVLLKKFNDNIVVDLIVASNFFRAEEKHQNYLKK